MTRAFLLKSMAFATLLASSSVWAQQVDVQHFVGKPANSAAEARANLKETHPKLEAILKRQKIDDDAMHEVHRLTYTLENAIHRLRAELEAAAESLEALHQSSEYMKADEAREHGKRYLEQIRAIVPGI